MEALEAALFSFRCDLDADIETFLHKDAIKYQRRRLCAVFLLLDEAELQQGRLWIEAYFTLSHKCLLSDTVGTTVKNKQAVTGGFRKKKVLEFVLIGQLGKYYAHCANQICSSKVTGEEILECAFELVRKASAIIPNRCVLVECSDEPKVRHVYEQYGFFFLQNDGEHNQYYKLI